MKSWIKWTVGGVATLVVLAAGAVAVGWQMAESKLQRRIEVPARAVAIPADLQSQERGKYLFRSRACIECHGGDGAGRTFIDNPDGMVVRGPNITLGGVTAAYKPEDWDRIIRHGVKPDGRPAIVMPSEDYARFTDEDLGALVSYMRALPPQPGGAGVVKLPLPVRVLYGFGAIPDAASRIDHQLPPQQPVPAAVNAQHGAYVANMCIGCHGERFSGGKIPGGPPDWPAAPNLTPGEGSAMTRYKDAAAFTAMMRSGKRPDGTAIQVMPFGSLGNMNDVDLQALYAYLKTVTARPTGQR